MFKARFLLPVFIMMIFCSSSLFGQNDYKHIPARGVMSRVVEFDCEGSHYCVRFDIVCNNCVIDGNIYLIDCPPTGDTNHILQTATYHTQLGTSGWEWGVDPFTNQLCSCYYKGGILNFGIPVDCLINLALHPDFPLDCCQGNSSGDAPCDTTELEIPDYSNEVCNRADVVCCGDTLKITLSLYHCSTGIIFGTTSFSAIYSGSGNASNNASNYNIHFDTPEEDSFYREILQKILDDPDFSLCQ